MGRTGALVMATLLLLGVTAPASALPEEDIARGKLLYSTHCMSCHAVEIHWRAKLLVTNWSSLKIQVGRWQKLAGLGWSEDDIEQVSAYLNATYYHFPASDRVGLGRKE